MSEEQQAANPQTGVAEVHKLGPTLLRVAWLAVLLGFVMEALLLLFAAGFGILPGLGEAVADLARQVSWSTIVCVGLAIGTVVSKARAQLMGLLGLLAAPLASTVARTVHQGTLGALTVAEKTSWFTSSLLFVAFLKGVEYGCLGLILGWIGQRAWGGAAAHVAAGLAVGLVFGSATGALNQLTAPEPLSTAKLVAQGVNEILFPVGCALVLFAATALGEKAGS